jgi:hypothetical protein
MTKSEFLELIKNVPDTTPIYINNSVGEIVVNEVTIKEVHSCSKKSKQTSILIK